ncbi:hypothetical protein EMWEY_00000400 [Eimeria maxima]|uniref:Uncharacterized protein n=1 Tax=Eimeria maxima TaxID=5804 RepID=U6M783_EIMMA|nr:hypothetical protein EMWEY_00000400 [Eimeria maxima]CDJ60047.1 hypothetical protein EMWEY_00000400 [Eimeria maxima]
MAKYSVYSVWTSWVAICCLSNCRYAQAREASYILSFSFYCSTDSSNSNISGGTALQLVAAAPALRCLTALVWIQSSSSPARTATAEAEDNTLAAAASSLRALLPVAVAATEFALASPSLVVRREAARSLLSMSLPLGETFWGATIAAAASAAPSKVVAAATGPVVGDPQLSLFILECLNSECDALQRRQLLQLLLQQVRIWGPRNPRQWILLLTMLCCKCVPAPTPTTQPLSTLRSSSSINDARAAGLLQRAQQLLPQTSQVLLSPLATARPLPALTGFVWRPLPGVSAPERVQHQDESCTDVNDSSVNNWSGGEVHPIVCSAAAECLELLLTLPELQQQQQQHWIVPPTDGYQAKYAEVEAASLGGPLLVDCLPLLFRAACQLLWQGTQRHQRQKQQLNGISSDEEISLCRRGLRILLLLLKRLTGVCSGCTTTQLRAAQQLQQHEVAVSSAVSALLRGYATPIAPERHDVPEAATAVAAALAAAAGYMAQAQHRAALLRLKAAATGGDVVQEEQYQQHHQQRLCDQEQRAQLTAMALEVMARFAEAGCCLSPWRLVGQLLLPLGDVVHSASDLVVAASATTPAADPYDWLVRRRLLLACRLLGHITAGAAPSDGAAHSTRAAAVFLEQHHQWVAAIEPCAVPLALHLMACLLKRHREREQQVEQWHQDQQQQEAQQLLKGLALLCHPLSTGGGEKRAAAASAAFAALSAASRSSTARRTVTAPEEAATAPTLAFPEACCPVLNGLADALIQPVETAKSSRESCPAAADWPEAAADEMCWRLESIGTMLLCLCFPPDPEQQQQHQQPHQQQLQPQQLDEDDWAEDWIGADSPTRSHGATTAPADASTVEASENSTGAVWLYPETLRRACEAAGRLAAAAAEAAAAASGLKTHYHCGSGGGGAVSSSLEHGKSHSSGGEETKSAAIEAAQKVELGATPAAVGAAGKIVYGCICFLWKLAGALKQNPAVLSEEAAAFAFFASMRDTSAAALWLPSDSAPLPAVELEEKLRGSMRGAALSLLQRGFSVVAVIPSAPAAASAVSLLLSPLEIPTFLSCFCNGTASGVSPLEAMHLLRSLYETAARAAGAVAAAAAGRTSKTKDTEATAHAANTSLLGHCAGLVESAVASFTGNADFLGTPPAAAAATSTVSSCAAGDTEGVLALAAALVAVDALALTNGPWNRRAMNEQEEQQQQQPGWCARIGTALQRLSEFAYLADSLRNHAALAPAAKTPNSAGATGSRDIVTTAETLPPAATRTNPNSSGKITANEREGAADTALVMESSSATATALTEAQAEAGTEAAVVHWPASCQHAAAQLRGFLLRIARLYNQSAAAGPDSFPCLLAAAAVSSLMPALTPYPSVPPRGGTRRTCSKGGRSYRVSKTQLSTIEAQQNHPLKTLEEFLVELSPQNSTAFGGSDLTPLSQVLVAALSSVIAGVLRIQAEACLSPDEGAAGSGEAAPAGLETETIGTATARNSASARLESRAATAEDVAPATAASEVETETAAPKSAVASPESLAVACTAAATETAALPVASLVTDSAAIAAAHLAALEATSDSGAPSSPAGAKTPPSSEAAARPESAGAAEEEPAPAKAPSSTPSGTTETKEPSAARRSAYLAAAASLLYLAVSRHPVVSARAIQAATEAVGEPASAGCTQLVKAAVARLLQEELKRRHHGRP